MHLDELREEIEIELDLMKDTVNELVSLKKDVMGKSPTVREKTAAGAFLAQFYGGVENVLKRIEELKAEALMHSAGQLEPAMVGLVMGLVRYFKVKAALLELSDTVADKVLERAVDFCKTLSPLSNVVENKETKTDSKILKAEPIVERKPLWEESDYEEVEPDEETSDSSE